MENENKWEYDYSSANNNDSGETGYPNVGSSGMNTANTASTYGEPAAPEAAASVSDAGSGTTPPPEGPAFHAAPEQKPRKKHKKEAGWARASWRWCWRPPWALWAVLPGPSLATAATKW